MITKRRCPHTGVVNFYEKTEPLLAIGSVTEGAEPARFIWRSYLDAPKAGVARDSTVAEVLLRVAIARAKHPHA